MKTISSELIYQKLAQQQSYVCITEIAKSLETSVSQVRHRLKELSDRLEHNDKDEWRIIPEPILSEAEKTERDDLERTVEQAFFIAGKSLKVLRDRRLYRETHSSFVAYVRDRFDFTRRAADYLISAAEIVENLKAQNREQIVLGTNVLPTKESQCRSLARLSPQEQRDAWSKAVELAGNKVPSSKLVKKAVREIKSVNNLIETNEENQPSFREVNYTAGVGVEYLIKLDEETYNRLQNYQDKIGSATKNGAVARLLDAIAEQK